MKPTAATLALLIICSALLYAQAVPEAAAPQAVSSQPSVPTEAAAQSSGLQPTSALTANTTEKGVVISEERIPGGSKVYVAPISDGLDTYIVAGLQRKKVPVVVVAYRDKADFEITGVSASDKAGWAKMLFMGSAQSAEEASIKVANLRTGAIVFAYSVHKGNSVRGKQSAGEACAKHIREKINSK
jgi:hypothetical protein